MMLRNSPSKDHQKNSPLKSRGIIKDSAKERCCFNDPQIDRIRYCFPANTVFKSFDPTALSDYVSETWVAFPVTPFTIGYTYPFPTFTQSFFSLTGISYIQAMPMIWRVLYTLERSRRGLTYECLSWARSLTVSYLKPAAKERLAAFRRLDPETRTFKTITQDSQEVSSGSSPCQVIAGKASKSASKFSLTNLDNVRSTKKKFPTSPTVSLPKAPTKERGGKKRKATEAEDLQGLPLIRHQFLEYFNDVRITVHAIISCLFEEHPVLNYSLPFLQKFAEIEDYVGHVEEQDKKIAELQQVALLKDLKIADLQKDLQDAKAETTKILINVDYEKQDITRDAKVSAAIAMYKTKIQMASDAQDPDFDKSSWDVEGWKARLAELDDEEEVEEIPMIEAGSSGKDHNGEASGAGDGGATKTIGRIANGGGILCLGDEAIVILPPFTFLHAMTTQTMDTRCQPMWMGHVLLVETWVGNFDNF
ncbi:hypothetical protein Hanom_Chr12g01083011 [Helianthus anomalus]